MLHRRRYLRLNSIYRSQTILTNDLQYNMTTKYHKDKCKAVLDVHSNISYLVSNEIYLISYWVIYWMITKIERYKNELFDQKKPFCIRRGWHTDSVSYLERLQYIRQFVWITLSLPKIVVIMMIQHIHIKLESLSFYLAKKKTSSFTSKKKI